MKTINLGSTAIAATTDRVQVLTDSPKIAVQVNLTGDPTAVTVDVEGSLDGTNFGVIETHIFTADELVAMSAYFYITDKPVPYYRINISTLTFTTAGTAETITRFE